MFRRMRINTQERAISGDINRLQSFIAKGFNEAMRHMLLIGTSDDDLNLYSEPSTVTSPLSAEILRGLCVRPSIGSLNLLVDSGVIFVVDPTNQGADDSICVPIETDGVTLPGALAMTGNASGSVRIDVIECRLNPVPLTATDNRDIFDPTTGLFTATTVTKEIEQQLEFRVRQGSPGAGYPGGASGWLPLAVAYVPNGAVTNDDITFWDVRPLAEDHAASPFNVDRKAERISFDGMLDRVSSSSWKLTGFYRGIYKGRRVGGTIRRGSPGTDGDFVDFFETMNKEGAIVEPLSTTDNYYFYLLFPFGLPRWSRYTDASAGLRAPRNPKGIPIFTTVKPKIDGTPQTAISLAAIFAGATTTGGIFVGLTKNNNSNQCANVFFAGRTARLGGLSTEGGSFSYSLGAVSNSTFVVPEVRIPMNATGVFANLQVTVTVPNASWASINLAMTVSRDGISDTSGSQPRNLNTYPGQWSYSNPTGGSTSRSLTTHTWLIDLPQLWPSNPTLPWQFNYNVLPNTPDGVTLRFFGWQF